MPSPITIVEPMVENIRRRPGMFIGDTGPYGCGHMISFVSDQIVDAERSGDDRLDIDLDGRTARISTSMTPREVDERFRALSIGGLDAQTMLNETWELLTVSALSSHFVFESAGRRFEGERGVGRLIDVASAPGFRVEFTLDAQIFDPHSTLDGRYGLKRSRELAFVLPGLRTTFTEHSTGRSGTWRAPHGMQDLVDELAADYRQPTWSFQGSWGEVSIDAAVHFERFEHSDRGAWVAASFANTVPTRGGGTHTKGLRRAITEAGAVLTSLSEYGWIGAIAVRMPRTQLEFHGPTKDVLGVKGLEQGLAELLRPSLREHLLQTGVASEPHGARR
jgi:DNA gyrase subunit B